jgi:hypothetical protein
MSTMAKFCSSVVRREAGEFVEDPPADGGLFHDGTLMCDGESRFPVFVAKFGDRGEEIDDFCPEFFAIRLGMIFPLFGVFCCFTPGDFNASRGCLGF